MFNRFCRALAKNGSFAKLGLWVGLCGFANVPFVRLTKIVFKKCALEKNKNTEELAFESAG